MTEKRGFHRTRYKEGCHLSHAAGSFHGTLENISLNGALLSVSDDSALSPGDSCRLSILIEEEKPLELAVEIMHVTFGMLGVRFTPGSVATHMRLLRLIERISEEPERLEEEMERIRLQIDTYLHP